MTEGSARTLANVMLGVAGAAAAYVVITTPPLRRFAVRAVRMWLGASIPVYLASQARDAWLQSRHA